MEKEELVQFLPLLLSLFGGGLGAAAGAAGTGALMTKGPTAAQAAGGIVDKLIPVKPTMTSVVTGATLPQAARAAPTAIGTMAPAAAPPRGWFTKLEDAMLGPEIASQPIEKSQAARWNARINAMAALASNRGPLGAVAGYGAAGQNYGAAQERATARDKRAKFEAILGKRMETETDPNERLRLELGQLSGSYSPPHATTFKPPTRISKKISDTMVQDYIFDSKTGQEIPDGKPYSRWKPGGAGGEKPLTPSQVNALKNTSRNRAWLLTKRPAEVKALLSSGDPFSINGAKAKDAVTQHVGESDEEFAAYMEQVQKYAGMGPAEEAAPTPPVVTPEHGGDVDSEVGAFLGGGAGTEDPYKNAPSQNLESPLSWYDQLVSPLDSSPRSEARRKKLMSDAIAERMREAEARRVRVHGGFRAGARY